MNHLSGEEYLAVLRGQMPEPRRPYSFDAGRISHRDYDEATGADVGTGLEQRCSAPPGCTGSAPHRLTYLRRPDGFRCRACEGKA